jgi:hypothetical protein
MLFLALVLKRRQRALLGSPFPRAAISVGVHSRPSRGWATCRRHNGATDVVVGGHRLGVSQLGVSSAVEVLEGRIS